MARPMTTQDDPGRHEPVHHKINYVEFAPADMAATQAFFAAAFGWHFEPYGSYLAFHGAGLDGGIYPANLANRPDTGRPDTGRPDTGRTETGGMLIIFYSADLAATERLVRQHGATIVKPPFSFPGGRRFHFAEPAGNEFAVWSDR